MSVCLSVLSSLPDYCTDRGPGCNLGNGTGCPVVVYYWADLQSVHGFRCYDNIAPNVKCPPVLVLALCLVKSVERTDSAIDLLNGLFCLSSGLIEKSWMIFLKLKTDTLSDISQSIVFRD